MNLLGKNKHYLGKSKFDKFNRISLIKEVADLFDMMDGEYVQFFISDGQIIIEKQTKPFDGYDFEKHEIIERIWEKERLLSGKPLPDDHEDDVEEERTREERAYENYKKAQEERKARRAKDKD